MIVKEYVDCIMLNKLSALNKRLPNHHPKKQYVTNDLTRKIAEKKGERAIHFPLSFLDEKNNSILYSVRIPDKQGHFQMDALLVTQNFILILEVKNWYGTILFGGNNQVIRVGDNNKEEGFPNPTTQINLQKHRLNNWLANNSFHNIPVYGFVVISFPSTIIKAIDDSVSIPEEIVYCNQLLFEIQNLNENNFKRKLSSQDRKKLTTLLLKEHKLFNKNIIASYQIVHNELIKGVICEKYLSAPMRRRINKWQCKSCGFTSLDAHIEALEDYRLLFKPHVKNRDIRLFLQLNSSYLTKSLLIQTGYSFRGENSARLYNLTTLLV